MALTYYKEEVKETPIEYRAYCAEKAEDGITIRHKIREGVYIDGYREHGIMCIDGRVYGGIALIIAKRIRGTKEWITNPDFKIN